MRAVVETLFKLKKEGKRRRERREASSNESLPCFERLTFFSRFLRRVGWMSGGGLFAHRLD